MSFDFDLNTILWIVLGVGVLGGVFYWNHLQGKVNQLEQELQTRKQREAALQDSLRTLKTYKDSLGNLRELQEIADLPVLDDEEVVDDSNVREELDEDVSRQTETAFSVDPDTIEGTSVGERVQEQSVWEHDITKSTRLYNFNVHLNVYSPGDSLDYTVSASTNEIKLRFFQYEDDGGINRTTVDSPVGVTVTGLDVRYRPEEPEDNDFEHLRFELPLVSASNIGGVRIGGGVRYQTGEFLGMSMVFRGGLTGPMPGVPQPEDNLPTLAPRVETAISF